jgi:hypothetical protein
MRTVVATPELVPFLLARMGEARVVRIPDAEAGIVRNIAQSTLAWCGLDDDGVVTMCGVLPTDDPATGYVWQFITDVASHKRAYLEQNRALIALMQEKYGRLISIIEAEYPAALRHVRHLGFTVSAPRDYAGTPACLCERTR